MTSASPAILVQATERLLKVSGVPMVEAAGKKKWGHDESYLHYVKHTSSVVPWFPAPAREGKTPPLL